MLLIKLPDKQNSSRDSKWNRKAATFLIATSLSELCSVVFLHVSELCACSFTFEQPEEAGLGVEQHIESQLNSEPLQISIIHDTVFVSLIPLWICVVFFVLCLKCQRPKNFPPGPPPLPILGNLLNLSLDNPMRDLERVRKTLTWTYTPDYQPRTFVPGSCPVYTR